MPLVRRDPAATAAASTQRPDAPAPKLSDPDPALRRAAAQAVGEGADPAPLAVALASERDAGVRDALFTALLRLRAAPVLFAMLRSDDASLRSGAIDTLGAMPDAILPHMAGLLADHDPDVRILAAEVARGLPAAQASLLLAAALEGEAHANAAASLVEVLAELGTSAALPALHAAAARFGQDPFLPFAIAAATARIGEQG